MMYLFIYDQIYWKILSEVKLFENKCDSFCGLQEQRLLKKKTMMLAMTHRLAKPKSFSHSQKSLR